VLRAQLAPAIVVVVLVVCLVMSHRHDTEGNIDRAVPATRKRRAGQPKRRLMGSPSTLPPAARKPRAGRSFRTWWRRCAGAASGTFAGAPPAVKAAWTRAIVIAPRASGRERRRPARC